MTIEIDKRSILLQVSGTNYLTLRSAAKSDIENLRMWKNIQKQYFFHKNEISVEQQHDWFIKFQERRLDFMFITEIEGQSFGCMGIRRLNGSWDAYNVILGVREYGAQGYMSKAFRTMIDFSLSIDDAPVTLQVLKSNPAVGWYEKNGFVPIEDKSDYLLMKYELKNCQRGTI